LKSGQSDSNPNLLMLRHWIPILLLGLDWIWIRSKVLMNLNSFFQKILNGSAWSFLKLSER